MYEKDRFSLADWRRQVAEMYAQVRQCPDPIEAWSDYRATRDRLFVSHSQTPLSDAQRALFTTIPYFNYNPTWRFAGRLDTDVEPETLEVMLSADGLFRFSRIAKIHFDVQGAAAMLSLFWVEGYGGGLFLPFRDGSNGRSTYGGGRYLYDGIKGADLNTNSDTFILDFNFAYNPSCAYNDQWVCPLAPPENWLSFPIEAGEQMYQK